MELYVSREWQLPLIQSAFNCWTSCTSQEVRKGNTTQIFFLKKSQFGRQYDCSGRTSCLPWSTRQRHPFQTKVRVYWKGTCPVISKMPVYLFYSFKKSFYSTISSLNMALWGFKKARGKKSNYHQNNYTWKLISSVNNKKQFKTAQHL